MTECVREPDELPAPNLAGDGIWEVTDRQDAPSAHGDGAVALEVGDKVRCEQSGQFGDNCSRAISHLFRFHVLTGTSAGACFWLETDENANLAGAGLRSRGT
jgi:hypothetical protein